MAYSLKRENGSEIVNRGQVFFAACVKNNESESLAEHMENWGVGWTQCVEESKKDGWELTFFVCETGNIATMKNVWKKWKNEHM